MSIEKKVEKILSDILKIKIDEDISNKNASSWNSLNYVSIVTELENVFEIEFSSEELPELNSFKNIVNIVKNKVSKEDGK